MEQIELDVVVIPEEKGESKVYSIMSVQVPNVVTQGDNIEDAKRMLKEALELYFEEHPKAKEDLLKIKVKENHPIFSKIAI